jgi:anti-sigma B factor antagonist
MLLQIEEREIQPGMTHIVLAGRLTLGRESQKVEAMATTLAAQGVAKVILDMTGVVYMDSAGIGVVTMASATLKQAGGRVVVVAPPEGRVRELLKMTGIDGILEMSPTVAAATAAFA